jgi:hypothetical protein
MPRCIHASRRVGWESFETQFAPQRRKVIDGTPPSLLVEAKAERPFDLRDRGLVLTKVG